MARASIGARRHAFTIELPVDQPDGFGGAARTYVAGPRVFGALAVTGAGERRVGGRAETLATHEIRLRWRAGLTGDMRLALGARRFAIRAAFDPDGTRRELVVRAEEVTP